MKTPFVTFVIFHRQYLQFGMAGSDRLHIRSLQVIELFLVTWPSFDLLVSEDVLRQLCVSFQEAGTLPFAIIKSPVAVFAFLL